MISSLSSISFCSAWYFKVYSVSCFSMLNSFWILVWTAVSSPLLASLSYSNSFLTRSNSCCLESSLCFNSLISSYWDLFVSVSYVCSLIILSNFPYSALVSFSYLLLNSLFSLSYLPCISSLSKSIFYLKALSSLFFSISF